jgi:hypothetical protein
MNRNVLRYGIFIGEIKKNIFHPAHHLYRSNKLRKHFKKVIDLNHEEYINYLKGLSVYKEADNGYHLLTYKGYAFSYTKVSNKVSFAFSSELTKEAFSEIIESNLTENYGLDPSFNIKIDDDYLGMIASEFSSQGQGATKIVNFEYVIYDDDGNYYDATTLFMIKKNIS